MSQIEKNRRGAAGLAATTKGRSKVIPGKSKVAPQYDEWDDYQPTIQVFLDCTKEWVSENTVKFEDIREDISGRDIITFTCPECGATHESLRTA